MNEILVGLLIVALLGVTVGAWHAYRWMFRTMREDASEFAAVMRGQRASIRASQELWETQARRIDCPTCGAPRGQSCRRSHLLTRHSGAHRARRVAYRQATR